MFIRVRLGRFGLRRRGWSSWSRIGSRSVGILVGLSCRLGIMIRIVVYSIYIGMGTPS